MGPLAEFTFPGPKAGGCPRIPLSLLDLQNGETRFESGQNETVKLLSKHSKFG
jgi:hypothetical protein